MSRYLIASEENLAYLAHYVDQIEKEGTGITKKTKVRKPTLKEIKDKALNRVKSKFKK